MNIASKIGSIAEGHANELLGLNKDLKVERLKICRQCPIYSPRFGGLCNRDLWFNPDTDEISDEPRDGYVRGCGCRLLAKTTLPHARCVAGKW